MVQGIARLKSRSGMTQAPGTGVGLNGVGCGSGVACLIARTGLVGGVRGKGRKGARYKLVSEAGVVCEHSGVSGIHYWNAVTLCFYNAR